MKCISLYQTKSGDLKLTKDENTLLKEMQIPNSTAQDDTRVMAQLPLCFLLGS